MMNPIYTNPTLEQCNSVADLRLCSAIIRGTKYYLTCRGQLDRANDMQSSLEGRSKERQVRYSGLTTGQLNLIEFGVASEEA